MGPAVFALIFLSSGYLLLRRWSITRPHALSWDGHALYFSVVVASIVLAVEADILREIVERSGALGVQFNAKISGVLSAFATENKLSVLGVTAVWSVPIAAISFTLLNVPIRFSSFLRVQLYLRLSCLGELEEFLLITSARNLPVMLTLASRKVYVGFSLEANASRGKKDWVRIEPLLSGYRDNDQEFVDTTDYSWLHAGGSQQNFRREDFDIIVPASEIVSAHAFDLNIYVQRFLNGGTSSSSASVPEGADTVSGASNARVERAAGQPTTKSERLYWSFCGALAGLAPVAYFSWWLVSVFWILMTALLAYASVIDSEGS
ncbi:MAG: hypothetical protein ABFC67_02870 [Mizugakiibacter sp.]|uniref:hypothetical protein n=1 Tax=Mizugakiibacter sp. TaxID=1972610 RepID=UPI0027F5C1FA|nr:hypothetical protein [Actinomycetes bacterium]